MLALRLIFPTTLLFLIIDNTSAITIKSRIFSSTFPTLWNHNINKNTANVESRALFNLIPSCAESCLQASIQSSFSCQNSLSLSCLCTNPSSSGLTLGELAIQCSVANCPGISEAQLQLAYGICVSISGAQQPTHKIITASVQIPTTILVPTTIPTTLSTISISSLTPTSSKASSSASQSSSETSSTSASSSTTGGHSISVISASSTTTSGSPTSLSSSAASSTAAVSTSSILTKPQIIGISVAGGTLVLVAMGLLGFLFCCKGRDRRGSGQSEGQQSLVYRAAPLGGLVSPEIRANRYVPSKAASVLGANYPVWSPATSPQGQLQATPNQFGLGPSPIRPRRDGTEGFLNVPSVKQTRPWPSHVAASPESTDGGMVVQKQPEDPFLRSPEAAYSRSIDSPRKQRPSPASLPRLNTTAIPFINPAPPQFAYNPADYPRFAQTQAEEWNSAAQNRPQLGIAITTGTMQAVAPEQTKEYRPAPPPKGGAPIFNKYVPIPPSKRQDIESTIATSFDSDSSVDLKVFLSMPDGFSAVPNQNLTSIAELPAPGRTLGHSQTHIQPRQNHPEWPSLKSTGTTISQLRYPNIPKITAAVVPRTTQAPISQPTTAGSFSATKQRSDYTLHQHYQTPSHQKTQQAFSPYEVSPLTPQVKQKEIVLPAWERMPIIPAAHTLATSAAPQQSVSPPTMISSQYPSLTARTATEPIRLPSLLEEDHHHPLNRGFVELPERGSSKRHIPDFPAAATQMRISQPPAPPPVAPVPATPQITISPLSPSPLSANPAQTSSSPPPRKSSLSPKSRGWRLGAAITRNTPVAEPKSQVHTQSQTQSLPQGTTIARNKSLSGRRVANSQAQQQPKAITTDDRGKSQSHAQILSSAVSSTGPPSAAGKTMTAAASDRVTGLRRSPTSYQASPSQPPLRTPS
jgi:hypothetical protein